MKNNRFEQFEDWYKSEAVYNLGTEDIANFVDEKDRKSVISKIAGFFTR